MPDYQGIGIGTKFLNAIAELYAEQGYEFSIVTSAKNLAHSLIKSEKWILCRHSASSYAGKNGKINTKDSTTRTNCKTFSFFYKK